MADHNACPYKTNGIEDRQQGTRVDTSTAPVPGEGGSSCACVYVLHAQVGAIDKTCIFGMRSQLSVYALAPPPIIKGPGYRPASFRFSPCISKEAIDSMSFALL